MLTFLIETVARFITRPLPVAEVDAPPAQPTVEQYDHSLPLLVGWFDGVAAVAGQSIRLPQTGAVAYVEPNGDLWVDGLYNGKAWLIEINYLYLISVGAIR